MVKLIDITMPWGPEVQVLEGHPRIQFKPLTTHEKEKRSNTEVIFSIHSGTHIDSPYHFFPNGTTIEKLPLEIFFGPAILVDLRQVGTSNHEITLHELITVGGLTEGLIQGKRVVLRTDWASKHWNKPTLYEDNPFLSVEAAKWLTDAGIVALGLDFAVDGGPPYPNHTILLENKIVLLENLVNLGSIPSREFTLIAFPLPVVGGDGSPTRAVAMI